MKIHLLTRIMILDFCHSFNDYDEILNFYGVWDYECPNPECRAKNHPMTRHARYGRSLVLWNKDTGQVKEEHMKILRLRCRSCGTTHSVLTLDIIPFFSFSIYAFLGLAALCMEPDSSVPKTEERTGVPFQTLYRFLRIFHEYTQRLALFLRHEGLWDCASRPLGRQLLRLILEGKAPPWPQSAFFHREHIPLFLHRQSTVSYPLLFGAVFPGSGEPT